MYLPLCVGSFVICVLVREVKSQKISAFYSFVVNRTGPEGPTPGPRDVWIRDVISNHIGKRGHIILISSLPIKSSICFIVQSLIFKRVLFQISCNISGSKVTVIRNVQASSKYHVHFKRPRLRVKRK